jgi:hypothetical protein
MTAATWPSRIVVTSSDATDLFIGGLFGYNPSGAKCTLYWLPLVKCVL